MKRLAFLCFPMAVLAVDAPRPVPRSRTIPDAAGETGGNPISKARKDLEEAAQHGSVQVLASQEKPIALPIKIEVFRVVRSEVKDEVNGHELLWSGNSVPMEKITAGLEHSTESLINGTLTQWVVFAAIQTLRRQTFKWTWLLRAEQARYIVGTNANSSDAGFLLAVTILFKDLQKFEIRFLKVSGTDKMDEITVRAVIENIENELRASANR